MSATLEIAANAVTTVAIVLAGRNNIHTWWTGILGCGLFAVLFYRTNLYADVALQAFFILSSVAGWRRWLKGDHGHALPITTVRAGKLALTTLAGIAATLAYGALLHHYTNAYAPFVDSAVLVFSIVAQLLLMQRRLENWTFWLLVNSIALPLYASRGLYLTAFLSACYWVNAVVSLLRWRRLARRPAALARA